VQFNEDKDQFPVNATTCKQSEGDGGINIAGEDGVIWEVYKLTGLHRRQGFRKQVGGAFYEPMVNVKNLCVSPFQILISWLSNNYLLRFV